MHSETFYKIGAIFQFLTALYLVFQGFDLLTIDILIPFNPSVEIFNIDYLQFIQGNYFIYTLFLINASIMNLLIARSGMPLSQFQAFILLNIVTWLLITIINFLYFPIVSRTLHCIILSAFITSYFTKPKFQ